MRFQISPFNILLIVSAGLILMSALTINIATDHPWLGLEFAPSTEGVKIVSVAKAGASDTAGLKVGDVIVSISSSSSSATEFLLAEDLIIEPDEYELYKDYFDFFNKQTRIYNILSASEIILTTLSDKSFTVIPSIRQPVSELSFYFWVQLFCGVAIVMMGAMIWVYARGQMGANFYMITAFFLMVAIFPSAIYTTRELAIEGNTFLFLSRLGHFGVMFFASFAGGILWYYPKRINNFPFSIFVLIIATASFLMIYLQVFESIRYSVYVPCILWLLLAMVLAMIQWKRTAKNPVERAQLKWFIIAWLSGPSVYVMANIFPVLMEYEPILNQKASWLLFLFMYISIAFGLTRYRLFDLDKWILTAWFWFLCGLGFILADLLLIALTGMSHDMSIMLVLALTGWLYFPLRQMSLDKILSRRTGGDNNSVLSGLFNEILQRAPNEKSDQLWPSLLQQLYKPLQLENVLGLDVHEVSIENSGQSILVPAVSGSLPLRLYNAQKGVRLFTPDDAKLIHAVWRLYEHVLAFQQEQYKGALKERRRIARDLHDDVSSKILSLVYRSDDEGNADLARETLSELRNVIHDLESPELSLNASVNEWKLEARRRCDEAEINLRWKQKKLPELDLLPGYRSSIRKIFRESLSNIIKHANATTVVVRIVYVNDALILRIEDDGVGFDLEVNKGGNTGIGLKNIHRRVSELNGELLIDSAHEIGCAIEITISLFNQILQAEVTRY